MGRVQNGCMLDMTRTPLVSQQFLTAQPAEGSLTHGHPAELEQGGLSDFGFRDVRRLAAR